mmetsp:Transcript_5746/g.9136  ORF Transcript_5746/g.9136 Transcript_5746/m.9136 type:complete len:127 (+) Transcript_5746:585-965(+)
MVKRVEKMTNVAQGVFITEKLFLPRYMWFKMKFNLPLAQEKSKLFDDISMALKEPLILYEKGKALIKHLNKLNKNLAVIEDKIMKVLGVNHSAAIRQTITSQDDDFMKEINEKYEGAGGQSASNFI